MNKILIVDDNPDIAFMLREKLQHFIGGDIAVVHDGTTCLEMVRQDPPDLLLLDICMPGIDGFEVCRLLKDDALLADLPVVFLSATYDDLRSKIKGLDLGADDYLVQPVDDLELVTKIKSVLQIKTVRDQIRILRHDLHRLREVVRDRLPAASPGGGDDGEGLATVRQAPEEECRQIAHTIRQITALIENGPLVPPRNSGAIDLRP